MLSRKNKVRKPDLHVATVTAMAAKKPTSTVMEVDLTSSSDDKIIPPIQHAKRTSLVDGKEAPPGWTPEMELINAPPEPAEPMSPAYCMAQMLKSSRRRSSSAIRKRREEAMKARKALEEEECRKYDLRLKNKPPPQRTKINFFSKPLPTSSDEEAEAEEARRSALECAQRTETEETCTTSAGTKDDDDDELDFNEGVLVTSTQMENDYQNKIESKSSTTISSSNQLRVTSRSENPETSETTSSSYYSQIVPTRTRFSENVRRRLWDGNVVSSSNTQNSKIEAKKSKIETKRETEDRPSTNLTTILESATPSSTTCQVDKPIDVILDIPGSMEDDMDGDAILSQLEIPQDSGVQKKDSSDTGKTETSSLVSPFDDEDDECGFDFLQALDQLEEDELSKIINSGETRSSGST